jgi:hypothetical protein
LDKSSKENMVNDIEKRLDNFFDESEEVNASKMQAISIEKLKSVILSIDWEITDDCLSELIDETDALLPHFEDDRFSHSLLRMLKAVGRYIRKRKAQAHPDAIKKIMSVFSSIEKLTENNEMEEDLKKQIVAKEISGFKSLKKQVEKKGDTAEKHSETPASSSEEFIEYEKFQQALNALEVRFNTQIEDVKSQLASLQKEVADKRSS